MFGFTSEWNTIDDNVFRIFKLSNNGTGIELSKGNIELSDYEMTRPGGKIIVYNKKRYFVSQICKPEYGSGLIIKEFELNWPDYREKEICRLYPKSFNVDKKRKWIGVHTLNCSENYVVIDLVSRRFSLFRVAMRLKNRIDSMTKRL